PAGSVLIGLLVVFSSWNLLRETVAVLMESAPADIDVDRVRDTLTGVPGVTAVHDLHVWSLTGGMVSLSAHLCLPAGADRDAVLATARDLLGEEFGIAHSTIQVE